jgi:hypothetical protein
MYVIYTYYSSTPFKLRRHRSSLDFLASPKREVARWPLIQPNKMRADIATPSAHAGAGAKSVSGTESNSVRESESDGESQTDSESKSEGE